MLRLNASRMSASPLIGMPNVLDDAVDGEAVRVTPATMAERAGDEDRVDRRALSCCD